jgi:hypothetical protein
MKRLKVDLDEVQKAMEDIERDAFDYFLDTETGDVVILSEDIISKAHMMLAGSFDEDMADYDEVEFDVDCTVPEWIEDEVELALDIFVHDKERYERIPERRSKGGYAAMKEYTESLKDSELKCELQNIIDGKGAFRRFKDALDRHPAEKKRWYGYNAKLARREILEWLSSLGVDLLKNQGESE